MAGELSGRIALVTGAARGIGLAIATRLAEAGTHVISRIACTIPVASTACKAMRRNVRVSLAAITSWLLL
jgi:NAD(P)-dependent dehydrogenase (short-subunit alcohol dehydrogenase family)